MTWRAYASIKKSRRSRTRSGWLFREAAAGPRAVHVDMIEDKKALRRQVDAWAERAIERIVVSHGRVITDAPAGLLRDIAQSL